MLKRICNIITNILLVFLILIIIFNLFSIFYSKFSGSNKKIDLFGYEFFIDISNSMEPEIKKGDLIVAKKIDFSNIKVGDIIIFNDIDNEITITHRVINVVENISGEITITTKGDMNNVSDTEVVTVDNFEAKYLFKISGLGTMLLYFSTGSGILTLVLIIATIMIISYLFSFISKEK